MENKIQELILTVVKSIVKHPDDVVLNCQHTDNEKGEFYQINIKVSSEDIPVCIGSGGATAEAIRRIAILHAKRLEYIKPLFVRIDAPRMVKNHFEFTE